MEKSEVKKNIVSTILGKSFILLLNFGIVIFTTRLFGAEGRGVIALFAANLNFVLIASNVFTGSSISYYLNRVGFSKLYLPTSLWIFFVSLLGAFISYLAGETTLFVFLFFISCLLGFITFHLSLFVGSQKIKLYNIFTVLQPLLHLSCMAIFYFAVEASFMAYFYGQAISLFIMVVLVHVLSYKMGNKIKLVWNKEVFKNNFRFGFQIELGNFFQFLNYRLTYYFLFLISGNASVGVFSIGITLSESIWIISRSISMVQYSKMLGENDEKSSRKEIINASKLSFYFTLIVLILVFFIPDKLFILVFGEDFGDVKQIMLWLSPGILALAVSNVYGHYFSAFGKLKILILKSALGAMVALILSWLLIPSYSTIGAGLATSAAHVCSSILLLYYFFRVKFIKKKS